MDDSALMSALVPEYAGQTESATESTPPDVTPEETAPELEVEEATEETAAEEVTVDDGQGDEGQDEPAGKEEMVPKKNYSELRKFATQKSMEAAEYRKKLEALMTQQQQHAENPLADRELRSKMPNIADLIDRQVQAKVSEYLVPLQQQQADLRVQSTVKALSVKYEDFDDVAEGFVEVLETQPEFFDIENGLELAYKIARAEHIERTAEAKAKAKLAAANATKAQKMSVTDATPITKGDQGQPSPEEAIRKAILNAGGRAHL